MGDESELGDKIGTFILPLLKNIEESFDFMISKSRLKIILSGFPNADLLCILLDSGYLKITNVDERKNVLQELRETVWEWYADKVSIVLFKSGDMCSIDGYGIIQCIVDNDPKIDEEYCHRVDELLLEGGSKLFLCLRKLDDLTILLSRFERGYMMTITSIGIDNLFLVIFEKLSPMLADWRFLIDHSQLESQSFLDLQMLCVQENKRRKDMRELIVTSDAIKAGILKFAKYATGEIVIPSDMVDLEELQVVKIDRHLKFALSTDNNKYMISIYDLMKLLSVKQFCTILLLDNTVTDSAAREITSHPQHYISLVKANTCRLVVIRQCEPAKYLNTKANVMLDLGDVCSKLSPNGNQVNTHWR
ncbi:uncharacterized protein [Spinacia oleracea]|uniref:Uncharacterized protein isoform X2 n=1 Tax=Spinacia oleracea TaxID=3562 RepID=A0ABM3R007_SPIOL|nr:uncharacterized protein LOC110777763 isoform X2 [Spinacia oleracea]